MIAKEAQPVKSLFCDAIHFDSCHPIMHSYAIQGQIEAKSLELVTIGEGVAVGVVI